MIEEIENDIICETQGEPKNYKMCVGIRRNQSIFKNLFRHKYNVSNG